MARNEIVGDELDPGIKMERELCKVFQELGLSCAI